MNRYCRIFGILVLPLFLLACAIADKNQQQLEEINIVQHLCMEGLLASGLYIESIEDKIPAFTRQKVTKLLVSAEIDSQFGKYPECLNRLERAYYFLSQLETDD